jgi:predicted metalloprotease with PDZ domain
LPLAELLACFGVSLGFRAATGPDDLGGSRRGAPGIRPLSLGAHFIERDIGIELTQLLDGAAAQAAGLNPGDHLLALDGRRVSARKLADLLSRYEEGETVTVGAFRRDEWRDFSLTLQAAPLTTCVLKLDDDTSAKSAARRELWLGT